ncbi:MAG: protein translocase subunit SecD [Candidatus Margulisiibacteriota bacterium]|nr:MAG: protein-export membrane protein SecD [Candidatus Margulisbacteria bacterium GWD2_39_127]OGI05499.1 MAG: protein-export membrane protein SecD [Candidatus Margulisbacteria bacterium GWF2_38_17]OGI08303.1 MAG: protein-export membrane protein SecD [Candidatus Margulisbacteria bacterium GWE2_39_32]PZM82299.1 MAG: protein translocase subunit SecD [Candidatus Margulisiibacteriota bacterium]HAR62955.1 protein translocase subunit SecD [Candidatus Margulisiibacteriota bacterium]
MKNIIKWKMLIILLLAAASIFILYTKPLNLGLDLQGGMYLVLEAQETPEVKVDADSVKGIEGVIRNRIDSLGVAEPIIQMKGKKQVIVELPGIKDPARAIKLIGDTALLEFVEAEYAPGDTSILTPEKIKKLAGEDARLATFSVYDNKGNIVDEKPIILKNTVLTGADLKTSRPETDSYGRPVVGIEFTQKGAKKFRDVTAKNIGKPIAIVLDNRIISAPVVNEAIPAGKAVITGSFTPQEVGDLVIKLKAGALPIPVEIVENKIIGPTLGKDSINKSWTAGIYGFIAVAIFMILYYRLPGLMAVIALSLYVIFNLAALSIFNATLTLTGLAGIILSMGMAVDANVLIFERLKEELRSGKTARAALDAGFKRAFTAIFDTNTTTVISGCVLFFLGTGTIRGFAVTLTLGVIVSFFTAIFVTRTFMEAIVKIRPIKSDILVKS